MHEPQITLDFLAISIYEDKIMEKPKKEEKGKARRIGDE
jgi:hypothetical protein